MGVDDFVGGDGVGGKGGGGGGARGSSGGGGGGVVDCLGDFGAGEEGRACYGYDALGRGG